jgi:hypothetical protein
LGLSNGAEKQKSNHPKTLPVTAVTVKARKISGIQMGEGLNKPDEENAHKHQIGEGGSSGLTLERYAADLDLPVEWLKNNGLATVDNPWNRNRKALSIRYMRRNGAWFRDRIRQATEPRQGRQFKSLWDKRDEKLGAMLYGLESVPAKGCPVVLVCDEAPCHILRFHGFDAVATQDSDGYWTKRDDPELDGLDITVFGPVDPEFRARLSRSAHWRRIKVATIDGVADLIDLHKRDRGQFAEIVNAALRIAVPLVGSDTGGEKAANPRSGDGASGFDGTIVDHLVAIAQRDGQFFSSEDGQTWADVWIDGRRETWRLGSHGFKNWLVHVYYRQSGRAPSPDSLNQAILTLNAAALYDGAVHTVGVRTGIVGGKYYLDLADAEWRAVEIDAEGWRVVKEPPIRFHRPRGMLPLPIPVAGGSISELQDLLNLAKDNDFTLIVAWLVQALRPVGPYPLLAIVGEPGAAKSTTARVLRSLTDPNVSCLRSTPREERDCWIAASNSGMLAFDNLSRIPDWLSDALCRIATGGGFATRALHTNDDEMLFNAVRPIMLTSVGEVVSRADLADRAIVIDLPAIPATKRLPERQFNAQLEASRPRILGALLDAMVIGIRNLDTVRLDSLPRLADWGHWATACEPSFAERGGVMKAYRENNIETVMSVLEGDIVCVALMKFIEIELPRSVADGEEVVVWQGAGGALLDRLLPLRPLGPAPGWPPNPQALSGRLKMTQRVLDQVGVQVLTGRTAESRWIKIIKRGGVAPINRDA